MFIVMCSFGLSDLNATFEMIITLFLVGVIQIGFMDVAFLPSSASFCTTLRKNCSRA